ncbi:helix-turn-helix domain-containing protein [Streptomyces sp. NPDC050704]|uniref:helix-turn-helix domain-containing protein n=1 Tax=Streptomyces sp. NPDC050704 TaxID=3157219 RepID=UPI00341C40B7
MSTGDDVEEFAALLRRLKARTDRSYGALARRLNMNTSTLHRYCAGDAVPLDFAPLERFAAMCGATPAERLELHRLWILAVAARQRPRASDTPESPEPDPAETEQSEDNDSSDGTTESGLSSGLSAPQEPLSAPRQPPTVPREPALSASSGPVPGPLPPPRPRSVWYRRRATVTVAVASALLATLGSLSALSQADRPSSDAVRDSGRTPTPTSTKAPGARDRTTPSPSPDTTRPSPSGSPTAKAPAPSSSAKSGGPSDEGKEKRPGSTAVPLTWTANSQVWKSGCGHDYVVDRPPQEVPPPPAPQDAGVWAGSQDAVHGRETIVQISVQGRTSTAVVLEALRVRVVGRTAPAKGNAFSMDQGCGGALTPRSFAVDLDVDRPIARSLPGNDTGTPIPAMRMPYQVSAQDSGVLLVTAETQTCDCRWYLELDWSSQGRTGTIRIDDHGRPFRTSGITGLPRYTYDTAERRWTPRID